MSQDLLGWEKGVTENDNRCRLRWFLHSSSLTWFSVGAWRSCQSCRQTAYMCWFTRHDVRILLLSCCCLVVFLKHFSCKLSLSIFPKGEYVRYIESLHWEESFLLTMLSAMILWTLEYIIEYLNKILSFYFLKGAPTYDKIQNLGRMVIANLVSKVPFSKLVFLSPSCLLSSRD